MKNLLVVSLILTGCAHTQPPPPPASAPPSAQVQPPAKAYRFPTLRGFVNDTVCAFNLVSLFYRSTPSGSSQPAEPGRTFFTCAGEP